MQTKTLIQASANVLRLTSLEKGNVVKVVNQEYNDTKILYGVVTDVLNSGDSAHVEILLFDKTYGDIQGKVKVYSGDVDIPIFPATVEEVHQNLGDAVKTMERKIEDKKEELAKHVKALNVAKEFVSGQTSRNLTMASFTEMSQDEFRKEVAAQKIKQIEAEV